MADQVTYCRIVKGLEKHGSDYLPTETELDITIGNAKPEAIYRWKKADLPRY